MREIERKRPRPVRRSRAPILVALVAVCAALALWLRFSDGGTPPDPPSKDPAQELLFSRKTEDLLSFSVTPSGGVKYTVLADGGTYSLMGDSSFPLDPARVGRIAEYISRVLVEDSVADLSADRLEPDDFGFSSPRVTVEGSFADGASVRFSVGDPLPSGIPRDYFLFEGSGKIHAVSVDVRETLDVELHRLHALPQVSFSPDLLDGALFGGRQAFRLIRGKDLWRIEEPFRYPADEAAVDRLLTLIRGMRFAYWISDAQGEGLSVFGLDAPRREVLFSLAPSVILRYGSGNELLEQRQVAAQELRFLVGNDVDGIGFYCQYDGSVYMASYLSMGFMAKADPWEYFSKAPLDLPAEALQSLSVRTDSGTDSYAFSLAERVLRNNQIAMDEHGSAVFDLYVEKNGLAVDTDAFLRFYGPLRHVSADGRLSEADAFQGDPILTVVLAFSGTERTVTFRRLDALHASMSVDGNAVHYVSLDEILPFIPE